MTISVEATRAILTQAGWKKSDFLVNGTLENWEMVEDIRPRVIHDEEVAFPIDEPRKGYEDEYARYMDRMERGLACGCGPRVAEAYWRYKIAESLTLELESMRENDVHPRTATTRNEITAYYDGIVDTIALVQGAAE